MESTEAGFHLSPQQAKLWSLQQDGSTYNGCLIASVSGKVNSNRIYRSIVQTIERYEILRTHFRQSVGRSLPLQVIRPELAPEWREIDLRTMTSSAQAEQLAALFEAERSRIFDLDNGVVVAASLIRLADTEYRLMLSVPAMCADAPTLVRIVHEICRYYDEGASSDGTEDPLQYADISAWLNTLATDDEQATLAREFWAQAEIATYVVPRLYGTKLSTAAACHDLDELTVSVLPGVIEMIRDQFVGVDLVQLFLLGCWNSLIYRLTGEQEFRIGYCTSGRQLEDLQSAFGPLAKCLPVRAGPGNAKMCGVVERLGSIIKEATEYQEYYTREARDGEDLADDLTYGFEFFDCVALETESGIRFNLLRQACRSERFDILVSCLQSEDDLKIMFRFNTSVYGRAEIERLSEQFLTLLQSAIEHPDAPIDRLRILPIEQKQQILVEWNATYNDFPPLCAHTLFEEHARANPQAEALAFEGAKLSYSQLNARANQLAHYLRKRGVRAGDLVALCMDRSLEMIVALLGILKAGAAYVPLDPTYPAERLAFLLEDSQATLVITQTHLAESLPAECFCLDANHVILDQQPTSNPDASATLSDLAYVIYTSGSTGTPKGVLVEHAQLSNYVQAVASRMQLPADCRYASVSTLAADLGNTVVFGALCSGGCLHLIAADRAMDGAALGAYFQAEAIDCLKIVPSHLSALLSGSAEEAAHVIPRRLLVLGGEASPWSLIDRVQALAPDCRILNHYGPTETTVGVLTHAVDAQAPRVSATLPLGRPLSNTRMYVLDPYGQPAPIGVAGELYIGGSQVARGYLNRGELTSERFVADSFSGASARLYRTGDLVRYLPDGALEFLGRGDDQIKIRGFRVELGEIESRLREHASIHEAVVLAISSEGAGNALSVEKLLVAFLVGSSGRSEAVSCSELSEYLSSRVPDYMIPGRYVWLSALPLSPNGKIDRQSLVVVAQSDTAEASEGYVAPRNPVEEVLCSIWAELLGLPRVGVNDNFFAIGGHSLLATQLVSRVRNVFRVDLTVRTLFESPTVAPLAAWIDDEKRSGASARPAVLPVSRDRTLPVSFGQQRLWFLDQLNPNSAVYNIPVRLQLLGELDRLALETSLNAIVQRHESLRTTFAIAEGEPIQVIQAFVPVGLNVTDLSGLPPEERSERSQRLMASESQRPFDLEIGPLFRFSLLCMAQQEHILLITMHHIVSDAWSRGVLIRELSAIYDAHSSTAALSLPELPVQYADYAVWQREWLQGEALERQIRYWKEHLKSAPALLELPTDRPRPPVQTFRGARLRREFSANLSSAVKQLAQREGATIFITLLAAFNVLLSRYGGQEDIVVGTPIANRTQSEVEGLIGFFVNTLALRTDLSGDPSFTELLARVREGSLGAYTHQDLPFEKLVEEIRPERNMAHSPVFQVMFTVQNSDAVLPQMYGLTVRPIGGVGVTAKFDLLLGVTESAGRLRAGLEYNTDLFDAERIERMLGHFGVLLEAIIADPEQKISSLPILTQAEQVQLLVEWNGTAAQYPREKCLHQLFEDQAARTPEAIALTFDRESITYAELDRRANQLAHYLSDHGVHSDVLVGLFLERSLQTIVGIIGILKAGGAYVPLDPAYPTERLAFMLDDANVPLVLTQESLRAQLPRTQAVSLCMDTQWAVVEPYSRKAPLDPVNPDDVAYVIYTSGSTGKPKGVQISHYNVARLFKATENWFGFNEHDVWTLFHSHAFDFSVWEIFGALLYGGRLVVVPYLISRSPEEFLQLLRRERVTVLNQTPSAFYQLIAADARSDSSSELALRYVIFGGEALELAHLKPWFERHGETTPQLINMYGITETTVHVTYRPLVIKDLDAALGSVIGVPIPDVQVYVLDPNMNPVPVGICGEMYVGGAGLARGYLNRPELTEERFVPDPFSGKADARLYKTGDLARWHDNGQLEYLGRMDHQVKIRGFRIELGEIEIRLQEHSDIRQAVVISREDVPGHKRLVAYLVANGWAEPNVTAMRAFLLECLPEYMVPSAWMWLTEIPMTPNGKLDRGALPLPDLESYPREAQHAESPNMLAVQLVNVWEHVFNIRPIDVRASFFDMGGTSLIAIQMLQLVEERIGRKLPLATLFQAQSIEQLASRLCEEDWSPPWSTVVPIEPGGGRPPLFCVQAVVGNLMTYHRMSQYLGPDQPVYGVQPYQLNGKEVGFTSVEQMATHCLEEIRTVQPHGPYYLAGYCTGGTVAIEMAQQLHAVGEPVALVALFDTFAPRQASRIARIQRFLRNSSRYIREWLQLRPVDRVPYVKRKRRILGLVTRTWLTYTYYKTMRSNQTVPETVQDFDQVTKRTLLSYRPGFYGGYTVLFRAQRKRRDPAQSWTGLIADLKVVDLVAEHSFIFKEPYVRDLAEKLSEALAIARDSYGNRNQKDQA